MMKKIRKGLYTDKEENLRVEKKEGQWVYSFFNMEEQKITGAAATLKSAIEKKKAYTQREIEKIAKETELW